MNTVEITRDMIFNEYLEGHHKAEEYKAGWYYSIIGNQLDGLLDVFRDTWNSTTGPVQENVAGPFKTEAEAVVDAGEFI